LNREKVNYNHPRQSCETGMTSAIMKKVKAV